MKTTDMKSPTREMILERIGYIEDDIRRRKARVISLEKDLAALRRALELCYPEK